MNFKKYLQQQIEKEDESLLTESDRQFCMMLAEDVQEKPVAKSNVIAEVLKSYTKLWAILGCMLLLIVAAIIVPFVLNHKPVNEIHYKEENISRKVCNFEELNNELSSFEIIPQENTECELYYDTVSNDCLYYTVKYKSVFSAFTLFFDINDNYILEFELSEDLNTILLSDYEVKYESERIKNFGDSEVHFKGVITLDTEIVYIEYNQLIDLGEEVFFEDIQSVLKVKN